MSDIAIAQNLPCGIPTPPTTPTVYTVYMSPILWERIEASLADPTDTLTVEGVCAFDTETNSMAVFATSIRSEFVQEKIRHAQMTAAAKEKTAKDAKAAKGAESPKSPKVPANKTANAAVPTQPQAKSAQKPHIAGIQRETVVKTATRSVPEEVINKLSELYASASLFRQKVTNLRGKPAGQQHGLEMAQKLLKNIEDEIAALEKKYKK